MARRTSSAKKRNATGEEYISQDGRGHWVLRLPKDLCPDRDRNRGRFFAPLTPEGLATLVRKRDSYITELDADRAKNAAIASPDHRSTVREVAELYLGWTGVKYAKERRRTLELYLLPHVGRMLMASLTHRECNEALDKLADKGLSRQTGEHAKKALNQLVKFAYKRDKIASTDWLLKVELPKLKVDERTRAIVEDHELDLLMNCPEVELELKVLSIAARCVGGARTSDLHAWRWEHVDLPSFATAYVPRPKTAGKKKNSKTVRVTILDVPKHFLRQWWLACGRPEAGFVFGKTRPRREGQGRKGEQRGRGTGYAARLRAALWTAGARRYELHNDTTDTRRADFHSFRRAYNTATANAGTNAQDAMQLAGHTDMETHLLYLQTRTVTTPEAAMPKIRLPAVE